MVRDVKEPHAGNWRMYARERKREGDGKREKKKVFSVQLGRQAETRRRVSELFR